ncbi:hypothetical protein D3C86_1355050 [compost metagenome]
MAGHFPHHVQHQLLLAHRQLRRQTADLDALTGGGKVVDEGFGLILGHARDRRRQPLEEIADVDLEEAGDVPELGGGDAVGALLVLLNLLKGQAQRPAQVALIIAQGDPLFANAPTDMTVHRMRTILCRASDHRAFSPKNYVRTQLLNCPEMRRIACGVTTIRATGVPSFL